MSQSADMPIVWKIARLVEERGWSQEEFARQAQLNRLTVRRLLLQKDCRVRVATISACARSLGLSVHELRSLPLDVLLSRQQLQERAGSQKVLHRLYEQATQPELIAWLERNAERARALQPDELDELYSLQGTGGPLTSQGVEHFVRLVERKRRLKERIDVIAGTHYLDLLEQVVDLVYERIQPYRDRASTRPAASPAATGSDGEPRRPDEPAPAAAGAG
jgi:hypothetical protein